MREIVFICLTSKYETSHSRQHHTPLIKGKCNNIKYWYSFRQCHNFSVCTLP
jgi:hypothetical protein